MRPRFKTAIFLSPFWCSCNIIKIPNCISNQQLHHHCHGEFTSSVTSIHQITQNHAYSSEPSLIHKRQCTSNGHSSNLIQTNGHKLNLWVNKRITNSYGNSPKKKQCKFKWSFTKSSIQTIANQILIGIHIKKNANLNGFSLNFQFKQIDT